MPPDSQNPPSSTLSDADVRKVARLARLTIPESEIPAYQRDLSAVIAHFERLKAVDLSGVEPLSGVLHGGGGTNRLAEDSPGATLPNETLMKLSPQTMPPFVKVPKVLEDGGGA